MRAMQSAALLKRMPAPSEVEAFDGAGMLQLWEVA